MISKTDIQYINDNCSWQCVNNWGEPVLKIIGSGPMPDFSCEQDVPWGYLRDVVKSIQISSSFTHIGDYAFVEFGIQEPGVSTDSSIDGLRYSFDPPRFDEQNQYYYSSSDSLADTDITSIGNYAFYRTMREQYELTIPSNIVEIGDFAFAGSDWDELHFEPGIEKIGSYAFNETGAEQLYSNSGIVLVIPATVKEIGDYAFCGFFEDGNLENGVYFDGDLPEKIGVRIFGDFYANTTKKHVIYYNPSRSGWDRWSLFDSGFHNGAPWERYYTDPIDSEESYVDFKPLYLTGKIGDTIDWVIDGDRHISFVGSGAMYQPKELYYNCSLIYPYLDLITSVTFSDEITELSERLFAPYSHLKGELRLPTKLTKIGEDTFAGCSGLTGSLVIPMGVTEIEDYVFSGCSGFTGNLVIPDGVHTIGHAAFSDCSGLTGNLSLPETIQTIGEAAFSGCSGLTGCLKLPKSFTKVEGGAFNGCGGFTELVVPDGVTAIEDYAFQHCEGIKKMTLPDSITTIGRNSFYHCSGIQGSFEFPEYLKSIGYGAFQGCGFEDWLVFKDKLEYIDRYAFSDCVGVRNVYFYGDAPSIAGFPFGSRDEGKFTVYHLADKSGWPAPGVKWNGYMTAIFVQ